MGYNTIYELNTYDCDRDVREILKILPYEGWEEMFFAIDINGDSKESSTWYEHEEDLQRLSGIFENIVFELHGQGDNQEDKWYKYFKNGKMQVCKAKITFEPYDENKLA